MLAVRRKPHSRAVLAFETKANGFRAKKKKKNVVESNGRSGERGDVKNKKTKTQIKIQLTDAACCALMSAASACRERVGVEDGRKEKT